MCMSNKTVITIIFMLFTFSILESSVKVHRQYYNKNRVVFGRIESLTSGENGSSSSLSCLDCNVAGGRGAISCACQGGTVGVEIPIIGGGISGGGASCEVEVGDGYFACCYKDSYGLCRCPSCKM